MSEYDIHVSFKKGTKAVAKEQFQYNYGEKLIFDDVDLPEYYEVHFANAKNGDAKKVIGDATGAIIPQEYFKPGQIIYAWVFFSNETSGKTVYEIVIPIARRAKPTDEPITPEEKSVVSQAIELLNETVENVEDSINSSLEAAKNSGEFDGKDGVDGSTQWISSRAPVSPNYTFYIYALSGTVGSRVKVNDTIFYENNLYQIISVDSFQVRCVLLANLKGDPGSFPESDAFLSDTSRNPVQNRIVKAAIDSKYTKPTSGVPATDLSDDVRESLRKADSAADADSVYTKTEIDQKLVGAMTYKGTKARVSDLPASDNEKGDAWHIDEDGSEWAWNGLVWEELGKAIDLSGYRSAAAQDEIDQAQDTAIAAKYTKPSTGIPYNDMSAEVRNRLDSAGIFYATYNVTTGAEIEAAYQAGKKIICVCEGCYLPLTYRSTDLSNPYYVFGSFVDLYGYHEVRCAILRYASWSIDNIYLDNYATFTDVADAINERVFKPFVLLMADNVSLVLNMAMGNQAPDMFINHGSRTLSHLLQVYVTGMHMEFYLPRAMLDGGAQTAFASFRIEALQGDTDTGTITSLTLSTTVEGKLYWAVLTPVSETTMTGTLNTIDLNLPSAQGVSF